MNKIKLSNIIAACALSMEWYRETIPSNWSTMRACRSLVSRTTDHAKDALRWSESTEQRKRNQTKNNLQSHWMMASTASVAVTMAATAKLLSIGFGARSRFISELLKLFSVLWRACVCHLTNACVVHHVTVTSDATAADAVVAVTAAAAAVVDVVNERLIVDRLLPRRTTWKRHTKHRANSAQLSFSLKKFDLFDLSSVAVFRMC